MLINLIACLSNVVRKTFIRQDMKSNSAFKVLGTLLDRLAYWNGNILCFGKKYSQLHVPLMCIDKMYETFQNTETIIPLKIITRNRLKLNDVMYRRKNM